MRFLFVKDELSWPRASGHDVHSFGMMSALCGAGHSVSLLTRVPCSAESLGDLELEAQLTFSDNAGSCPETIASQTGLQRKFCSYWGVPASRISEVGQLAEKLEADVVVVVGIEVLPYLTAVKHAQRVWYAADEWVVHHLSQFFFTRPESWKKLWAALIMGAYEWAFSPTTDRVWLVSQRDARAARLVMRGIHADLVPNGVDSDHFAPQGALELDQSCVFWGRLDFGPNVDALRWFAKNVWDPLSKRYKGATFTVLGFNPGEEVRQLASEFGFELIPDQPDIRTLICQRQLVVLPFISGAGIKNKLLEAASLARPVLASKTALNGVNLSGEQAVVVVSRPRDWIIQISRLWEDAPKRARLGTAARAWVKREYTWPAAAKRVVAGLAGGVPRCV